MRAISFILVSVVALLHIYFLVLEMFLWTKPLGRKVFKNSVEKAQDTAVMAGNQGLYNGFLSAGLIWGMLHPNLNFERQIIIFFLACAMIAGLYGTLTVNRKILFVQFGPAFFAWISIFLS